jgi:hypothetical protein
MNSFDLISKGLLPFLGGMRRFIPFLFEAVSEVAPMSEWPKWSYHDMTCGSCAGSAAFGFYGMSVTANDLALRSYVSAQAIFGGATSDKNLLVSILDEAVLGSPSPQGKTPAYELIPDHLHPLACNVFDALYYAPERLALSPQDAAYCRYMAVRWVLLNKNYMYFLKLPTRDLQQLELQGAQWKKTVGIIRQPAKHLLKVAHGVDQLIHALGSAGHERQPLVLQGDCREAIKQVQWDRPSFVGLNPPTAGNSTFMQSNRVLDTLLFNERQAMDDGEMPGDLWKSLILDTAKHIPSGHYVFSFVGDGAISWEEGCADVFPQIGPAIKEWSFPWHASSSRRAGLILLRKS